MRFNFPTLTLKRGRERAVLLRHPWLFSGAVEYAPDIPSGSIVGIATPAGQIIAYGHYHPESQIRVRIFHVGTVPPDGFGTVFFTNLLDTAAKLRSQFRVYQPGVTTAFRLFNAEGDGLGGLIIDVYENTAVLQLRTAGVESLKTMIIDYLRQKGQFQQIIIRPEEGEGFFECGQDRIVRFKEHGLLFEADVIAGQKTGFFLDQRDNRQIVGQFAGNKTMLNAFGYTGGFALSALKYGALSAVNVDISASACEQFNNHLKINGFESKGLAIKADCFAYLRQLSPGSFDMIVLDPPAFSKHISTVDRAARGYKDINLLAFKAIAPKGILATFSCSQHVSKMLFRQIIFGAAADSGRNVRVIKCLGHGADHPVSIYHPEGEYLKGLLLEVD